MTGSVVAGFAAAGAGLAPGVAEARGGAACWDGPGEAVCAALVAGVAGDCTGADAAPVDVLGAIPCGWLAGVGRRCALPALGVALFGAGDAVAC